MNSLLSVAILCLGIIGSSASGDVIAEVIPEGTGGSVDVDLVSGKWEVVFDRSDISGDVELWVYGEDTDTIRFITIESGATASADTEITVRGYDPLDRVGAVERIEEIGGAGETWLMELRVQYDLGNGDSDEGCVIVDRIESADIGQDVTGKIITTTGAIKDFLVGRDFLGDLECTALRLQKLDVTGSIGSAGTPVTFNIKQNLEDVEAAAIHAHITVGWTDGTKRYINRLVTTSGDLTGSISADAVTTTGVLTEGIDIAGDMTASLTLTNELKAPLTIGGDAVGDISVEYLTFSANGPGTITIGNKLIGDLIIDDAGGVDQQVIFNANNNVYTPWEDAWAGDVIIDGETLDPGTYADTDIGDAAVGIARFTCHLQACVPPSDTTLTAQPANNRIELQHYGPVAPFYGPSTPSFPMVKVERSPMGSNTWTNVTASFDSDFTNDDRLLIVQPATGNWGAEDYDYRLTHVPGGGGAVPPSGYLVCKDPVAGNPSLLAYTYYFTLDLPP